MKRSILVTSLGVCILNFVRKHCKASHYHISSKGTKVLAFPLLISLIWAIIGCQSNQGLVESQRHEVIVPPALSSEKIDQKKDKRISKPKNEFYFGKERLGLHGKKDPETSIILNRQNVSESDAEEKPQALGAKILPSISKKKISEVGILLPLSGNVDQIGGALLDSIQLAFFEVSNLNVELLIFDTRGESWPQQSRSTQQS